MKTFLVSLTEDEVVEHSCKILENVGDNVKHARFNLVDDSPVAIQSIDESINMLIALKLLLEQVRDSK